MGGRVFRGFAPFYPGVCGGFLGRVRMVLNF